MHYANSFVSEKNCTNIFDGPIEILFVSKADKI